MLKLNAHSACLQLASVLLARGHPLREVENVAAACLEVLRSHGCGRPLRDQAAELVRSARKDKGLTQLELSEFLGVSHRTLQRWEAAESTVSFGELEVIGRALGLRLHLTFTPAE